jgi:hypothetical protein
MFKKKKKENHMMNIITITTTMMNIITITMMSTITTSMIIIIMKYTILKDLADIINGEETEMEIRSVIMKDLIHMIKHYGQWVIMNNNVVLIIMKITAATYAGCARATSTASSGATTTQTATTCSATWAAATRAAAPDPIIMITIMMNITMNIILITLTNIGQIVQIDVAFKLILDN